MGIKSKIAVLVALVCSSALTLQTASAQVPAGTACTQPRVRKAWEDYSQEEKDTYLGALRLAISSGLHQKFVELHTEWFSELEAHRTCVFIYWHRMYLLGFENMLRSMGPQYQCVTLPVYDHLAATARRSSGECVYMEGCSPLLQDLGGTRVGNTKNIVVYNQTIVRPSGGLCVTESVLSSFCGNNTGGCAGCVVRGAAHTRFYPAEAYFGSVYQQVFSASDWSTFAMNVERGVHNTVHSALSGTMSYFQSPIDPIFYSHHSFIDALQTVYFKCQNNGEVMISSTQKSSDSRFWANCPRRNGGTFAGSSTITMRTRDYSGAWVHVRTNPRNTLYPYFKDLPGNYAAYVDAKDLGIYSYTYQFSGGLSNMYVNCINSNTPQAAVLEADEADESDQRYKLLRPIIHAGCKEEDKMRRWSIAIYESARFAGYTTEAARDQMEMILCVHKDECLGEVEDFDEIFRQNFHVEGHPRCYSILQLLKEGKRIIGVPGWREITEKFLPCPTPKEDTVPDRVSATA